MQESKGLEQNTANTTNPAYKYRFLFAKKRTIERTGHINTEEQWNELFCKRNKSKLN